MRRLAFAASLALCMLVVPAGIELTARLYLVTRAAPTMKALRLAHPAQYDAAPYWSAEFVEEYDNLGWQFTEAGYFIPTSFKGRYYDTTDGLRHTTDQPATYANTIYMLGNSGLFDPYVPDGYTIASQLQQMVNRAGLPYRVVNLGVDGTPVEIELLRLKELPLKPGDIAVFYDGVLDMADIQHEARQVVREHNALCSSLLSGPYASMAVSEAACGWINTVTPAELTDTAWIAPRIQKMQAKRTRAVSEAWAFARSHGAAFYEFRQPDYAPEPWASLYRQIPLSPWGVDLSNVMTREELAATMLDTEHMTEKGDRVVARSIFDQLTIF